MLGLRVARAADRHRDTLMAALGVKPGFGMSAGQSMKC